MSDIDLSKLSLDELDKLLNNAAEAKSKKRKEEVAGAIVTIQGLVDKYNILPHEIFGNLAKYGDKPTKLSKDKKDPKSAKYIFTDEKGEFHHWFAGKGPRPQFIKDILGEDKKEADCTKELAKYLNPNWK
jgi:DNA-binding protein H-NS